VSTPGTGPAEILRRLVASDPGRPRITAYDDTDSPTRGERIELSARVLANWVAKAANLLQDDLDAGVGTVVRLDLPPHWRTLYWALAVWSVGGCVDVPPNRTGGAGSPDGRAPGGADGAGGAEADVVVTDDPGASQGEASVVLVTLAALARAASVPIPDGAVDEARELATHGDVFEPWDAPADHDPALRADGDGTAYAELVPRDERAELVPRDERTELVPRDEGTVRVHTATGDTAAFLRLALGVLAVDGSLVLTRGAPSPDVLEARLQAEGVTRTG
jgi:uncharacterized protein (TIGR03089 family)